jgi:hypothetical protein
MKVIARTNARSVDGWLDPDVRLSVLAIQSRPTDGSMLLLWSERQATAVLFPASDFDVIDDDLPSAWGVKVDLNGYIELAPREWLKDGFWERYHDGDPEAEAAFAVGRAAVMLGKGETRRG